MDQFKYVGFVAIALENGSNGAMNSEVKGKSIGMHKKAFQTQKYVNGCTAITPI